MPSQVGEDGATVVKPSSRHASDKLAARSLPHVELPSLLDDHTQNVHRDSWTPKMHPWEDHETRRTDAQLASFLLGIKRRGGDVPRTRETNFLAMGAKLEVNASMEMKLSLGHSTGSPRRGSVVSRNENNPGETTQTYANREVRSCFLVVHAFDKSMTLFLLHFRTQAGEWNESLEREDICMPKELSFKETIERRAKVQVQTILFRVPAYVQTN